MKIYRISQIIEDPKDTYMDVAHYKSGGYLWAFVNGHLEVCKMWDEFACHRDCWETEFQEKEVPYFGRFDSNVNVCSISSPPNTMQSYKQIPSVVERSLRNKFGENIEIRRYQ